MRGSLGKNEREGTCEKGGYRADVFCEPVEKIAGFYFEITLLYFTVNKIL